MIIPSGVTTIHNRSFSGCSGITSVVIPNSVTSIDGNAFSDCSGITSIIIGNSVKSISSSTFANCPELTDVFCYAETVPSTNSNAFDGSYIDYATLHVPEVTERPNLGATLEPLKLLMEKHLSLRNAPPPPLPTPMARFVFPARLKEWSLCLR